MTALTLDNVDIHSTKLLAERGYPWEAWDLLRREAPVHWYEREDIDPFWALTKYDDIHFVGSNHELFINGGPRLRLASKADIAASERHRQRRVKVLGWDPDEVSDMVFMDRPRHTEFRNLTARGFTPRSMRRLEDHLGQYATQFSAEFAAVLERDGHADIVHDLAVKLPLATICDLMGLPFEDWERIHAWTEMIFVDEDNLRYAKPGETYADLQRRMSDEFHAYMDQMIERNQSCPAEDLAAKVVNGEVGGCPLTTQQLHGYLFLLIAAGNETTRNATTGGVIALLQHPDQLARLVANPDLVDDAVEEILRWVSPVIQFARTATADVELRGKRIRKGDTVGVFYPSANRDEDQFPDPYRFDIGRTPNYHQAFGHGVHFCLGANLARWELRATFGALLPLLPKLQLVGEPDRIGHLHLGAVKHQQVALR